MNKAKPKMAAGADVIRRLLMWTGLNCFAVQESNIEERQAQCPRVVVRLQGKEVLALLDSGSEVSLMSHQLYEDLKGDLRLLPKARIMLNAANGDQFPILHSVQGSVRLTNKSSRKRLVNLHVVKTLNRKDYIILGADFMEQNGVTLDMGSRKVKLGKATLEPGPEKGLRFVNRITCEAKAETVIPGTAPGLKEGDKVLVEVAHAPDGMIALDGVNVVNKHNQVGIHLVNTTANTLQIKGADLKAVFTPLKYVETIEMGETIDRRKIRPRTEETDQYVNQNADVGKLPGQWQLPFRRMLQRYQDVYARNHLDVGDCPVLPHEIRLTDPSKVVNIPPYRVPYHLIAVQHAYVDDLLAAGVIRPSNSPWSSPIMMVKKANADPKLPVASQYRMVHNYKKVNELIKPSSYPLTNLYQLIDEVASRKIYTVLDLSQGYFNQRCIDKHGATAFNVPGRGTYIYNKSPMGTSSSPAAFQRLTEYILKGLDNTFVYLDDIIIATNTYKEHLDAVEKVLQRLRHYNLKINLRKAHFGHEETNYLGYKISNRSITPGDRKVKAIREAAVPKTTTQIKSFLGLCSFFRKTVPRFSEISAPLNRLTRMDSNYKGG